MEPSTRDVLVLIDMQNGFIRPASAHVVPEVVGLVHDWVAAGGAVLFTRYLNYPGSPYTRILDWHKCQTSPEVDIIPELIPYIESGVVLNKTVYSVFTEEGSVLVKEHGWENLYFCGIDTEACVMQSAIGAFERGLTPHVITDACASHDHADLHRAGLMLLRKNIGPRQLITRADLSLRPTEA
ncbi:cysteine hydrolase [Nocardiopsis gilva YIM 90087]|uniref:Cysteine hydrolase n=1 Tax=Nocardiopsis gilva YIM 90087 TaxID=1235441 RepID=A0A223S874_9ACTN|nr:isochorismatase family cysteine hydrolase [Nocardiopsis gilva]ASU84282.1 cysteine hydrolase [Nocardiopsis gilva YIM 90087]